MTDPATTDERDLPGDSPIGDDKSNFFATAMAFELGLGAIAVVIGWFLQFNPLATVYPGTHEARTFGSDLLWGVAGALPMLAGLFFFDRYPIGPLKGLKELTQRVVIPLFSGLRIWQLALLSCAAGLGEETLFRGLIQAGLGHWLTTRSDEWLACFIASVLFGLCHWLSATYGILAIFVGLYLGGMFLLTESLLPPIIAHALYDLVALIYFVKRPVAQSLRD